MKRLHEALRQQHALSPEKAREMLHNPPHGKPLTKRQRGLFGLIASGKRPMRMMR